MLSAVMLVLAARSFWAFLRRPDAVSAMLAGLALGLAQTTKLTLLILYPCWVVLFIGRALQHRGGGMAEPREQPTTPTRLIALGLVVLMISVVVVDALYLFRDVGFHLEQLQPGQLSLLRDIHHLQEHSVTAWLLQIPLPIPLEFLRGLDFQLADSERQQSAYLLGWTRLGGWWYWYAVASLIKTPLPVVVLFGLALFRLPVALRDRNPVVWATLCLLIPAAEAALVISATTGTGTNAAFRYLVPSLSLLCVWVGHAWSAGSRSVRLTSIPLLGWLLVNAVVSTPDHLGWQNELGWGWSCLSGRPALIGDSLDWCQDLPATRRLGLSPLQRGKHVGVRLRPGGR